MSRAYMLTKHHNLDVELVDEHASLRYIFPSHDGRPGFWDPRLVTEAIRRMRADGFDPDRDYLVVAGHMASTVRLAVAVADAWPSARGLFWDAIMKTYTPHLLLETDDGNESRSRGPVQAGKGAA